MSRSNFDQDWTLLAARIRAELIDIAQIVERANYLLAKAIQHNDDDYYDGIALNLHSFYTGIERILEDIAREIDASVPTGQNWHRDLLTQMTAQISGVRPAVLKRSSRDSLDEYRGLRHVIRNVYTFNLKPSRLRVLVADLSACYQAVNEDLNHFCDFLESIDPPEPALS